MPWSAAQRQRLAFEKSLLEKYYRNGVTWIDPTGDTEVEVRVICTNNKQHTLRVYITIGFPNSLPPMVVKTPSMTTLKRRDGSELEGATEHTSGIRDGCTQIDHCRPQLWKENNTLFQVVMKGLVWLEVHETHLRTGASLDRYMASMSMIAPQEYQNYLFQPIFFCLFLCFIWSCIRCHQATPNSQNRMCFIHN